MTKFKGMEELNNALCIQVPCKSSETYYVPIPNGMISCVFLVEWDVDLAYHLIEEDILVMKHPNSELAVLGQVSEFSKNKNGKLAIIIKLIGRVEPIYAESISGDVFRIWYRFVGDIEPSEEEFRSETFEEKIKDLFVFIGLIEHDGYFSKEDIDATDVDIEDMDIDMVGNFIDILVSNCIKYSPFQPIEQDLLAVLDELNVAMRLDKALSAASKSWQIAKDQIEKKEAQKNIPAKTESGETDDESPEEISREDLVRDLIFNKKKGEDKDE